VQYTPTHGRAYKVYIIDEVHMLSTPAWNALLKTLEEPPPHVKFLFATTEAHKVLPTILSRCQRFDLKRIPITLIVRRLREIADAEQTHIDDAALTVIARAAEGGMRDAQSILDQMIAFCGGDTEATRIREPDVIDVFGLASQAELVQLAEAMLKDDAQGLVLALHHLADRGRDLERLYTDLLLFLRSIMVTQVVETPETVLALSAEELHGLKRLAQAGPTAVVQTLVEGLMSADGGIRNTLNKRVFVETTLLRVMRHAHAVRIDDLITRLRTLHEGTGSSPDSQAPAPAVDSQQRPVATPKPAPAGATSARSETAAPPTQQATGPQQASPAPARPAPPPAQASSSPHQAAAPATESRCPAGEPPADSPGARTTGRESGSDAASGARSRAPRTASSKTWKELEENDFVSGVCDLFGGKIVDVRD
jgi:DNA polymerase-3 subunit gamma/tau